MATKSKVTIDFTPEEKARWKEMILQTWDAIGPDCIQVCGGSCSRAEAIELTLDANRVMTYAGMTLQEDRVLTKLYPSHEFQSWLKKEVFTCSSYVG